MSRRNLVPLNVGAERLGVSIKTIRRRIAAGELTAYRVGTKIIRIDLEEVDGLLHRIPTSGGAAA